MLLAKPGMRTAISVFTAIQQLVVQAFWLFCAITCSQKHGWIQSCNQKLCLFAHIPSYNVQIITFPKPTLLPSSGEKDRLIHLLWRTHQKELVSVTGPSKCLSWPKYATATKYLYSLWTGPGLRYIFWPADLTTLREITRETAFPSCLRLGTEPLAAHICSCSPTFQYSVSTTFSRFTQTQDQWIWDGWDVLTIRWTTTKIHYGTIQKGEDLIYAAAETWFLLSIAYCWR